jgi:hypothetical protein
MFRKVILAFVAALALASEAQAGWDTLEIRESMEKSVFQVSPQKEPETVGTAFTVKAPSGKVYTLTNRHICDDSKDGYLYFFNSDEKLVGKRKILEKYNKHDLCLLEAMKDSPPITVADKVHIEHIAVVGHPLGYPLTAVIGDLVGTRDIQIEDSGTSPDDCEKLPNRKLHMDPMRLMFEQDPRVCVFSAPAYATTVINGPGGSGSPAINQDEELIGVMFAYSSEVAWGKLVPLDFVKDFLKKR